VSRNDTYIIMIQELKKTTFITVSSPKKLSEIRQFTLSNWKENGCHFTMWITEAYRTNVKIAMCQFVPISSAVFLPNIIWIGLQLGKLSQK